MSSKVEYVDNYILGKHFQCIVCKQLAWEPKMCLGSNTHFCCNDCLGEVKTLECDDKPLCTCGSIFKDCLKIFQDILDEQHVYCINRCHGCTEIMEKAELKNHINNCEFSSHKCDVKILDKHGNLVECDYNINYGVTHIHCCFSNYGCKKTFDDLNDYKRHRDICKFEGISIMIENQMNEIKELKTKIVNNQSEIIDELKTEIKEKSNLVNWYQNRIDLLRTESNNKYNKLKEKINKLEEEYNKTKEELIDKNDKIKDLKENNENLLLIARMLENKCYDNINKHYES